MELPISPNVEGTFGGGGPCIQIGKKKQDPLLGSRASGPQESLGTQLETAAPALPPTSNSPPALPFCPSGPMELGTRLCGMESTQEAWLLLTPDSTEMSLNSRST